MSTPHDPSEPTVDQPPPAGSALDAGLSAAFGPDSGPPLPAGSAVVSALGASLGAVPRVLLRDPEGETAAPVGRPGSDQMLPPDATGRYQLLGEIARGGMGAVFKGRDADLGRDVAVKVLLEAHAGRVELARRFVEEAQIAGQLQHPGVVPVYELGVCPDRRPYFAMKLVEGRTLAALLRERPDPSHDRPRFVGVFLKVCEAVAYAHARGVIHRDLKPSNVMVGSFGEVQVIDWGLAKVLARGGAADEAAPDDAGLIRTARSSGAGTPVGSDTQAGRVLGTPAYMSPEQARGEVDRLDERCDVFGLGAVLCEVLTGKPPYAGTAGSDQYRLAERADLADACARLDGCGADTELTGLAKRCLAPEPAARPRDAGAVAAELTRYLDGVAERLRRAEVERAEALVRAAGERKRRRLTAALAAAAVLLLAGGSGGWLWLQHERHQRDAERAHRRELTGRTVERWLTEADLLGRQARWAEALAAAGRAEELLAEQDPAEPPERARRLRADLAMAQRLEGIRLAHAGRMRNDQFDYAAASAAFADAFRAYGIDLTALDPAAAADRVAASPIKDPLVAALDEWARSLREDDRATMGRVLAVARRADPDDWRNRFRDLLARPDRAALEELAGRPEAGDLPPATAALLADALARAGAVPRAVAVLRRAQQSHPADFWLNHELAFYLMTLEPAPDEEALGFYRAALALQPDSPGTHYNLGNALSPLGRPDEAEAAYRRAIELQADYSYPHNNLGALLRQRGRSEEAVAEFRRAVAAQPGNANARQNLAATLDDLGRREEALAARQALVKLRPTSAADHDGLGTACYRLGRLDEAIAEFRRAVELGPGEPGYHSNLGLALTEAGRYDEAVAALDNAVRLAPGSAAAHKNRGLALARKGDLPGAVAAWREAVRLRPDDSQAHSNLGSAFYRQGKLPEAVAACEQAVRLDPANADGHHNLGLALADLGRYDGAAAAFRRELGLRPRSAGVHFHLARALERLGDPAGAEAAYRESARLQPARAPTHYNLGVVLEAQGKYAEAEAAYREAVRLDPKLEVAHCNLGIALERQGRSAEAADAFRRAVGLDPDDALAHFGFARVLAGQGRYETVLPAKAKAALRRQALAELRAALAAPPDRQTLRQMQGEPALAAVRDPAALAALPEAERAAWAEFWADAAVLLAKVSAPG
jgi:serine/threonine-protein kinase